MSESIPEDLVMDTPVLQVRWRLQNNALPLLNRHLRAFAQRGVSRGLQSWARQHLEWTLAEGSLGDPNGVLTIDVDEAGRSVMGIEPFVELEPLTVPLMAERVQQQAQNPVESEVMWVAQESRLTALSSPSKPLSGVNSLVCDLAKTLKATVEFDESLLTACLQDPGVISPDSQVFLASDEYGIVPAVGHDGDICKQYASYYARIVGLAHADAYDKANLGLR
ncbi:MAG: hypothetical protein IKE43_05865 [Coriobacteriales bacterium]|nr:hypothetical protein [Coriobacteriales bacterium]